MLSFFVVDTAAVVELVVVAAAIMMVFRVMVAVSLSLV